MPQCIIMGCRLVIPQEGRSVWGDLHMLGGTFIFNCVLKFDVNIGHKARWEYDHPDDEDDRVFRRSVSEKHVILSDGTFYFERRGVIVFEALHSTFNEAAKAHLKKDPYYAASREG